MIYCTLFNSNYIDKGLVLYESLMKVCSDFQLYVLCMDDLCAEILLKYDAPYLKPITLAEFENERLLRIKKQRSFGEYCWTCTPLLIKHILKDKGHPICTYVDADMCFYSDPNKIIEKYVNEEHPVLFVPHNFSLLFQGKEKEVGRYCVEFNPFMNNEKGNRILDEWAELCIKSCSLDRDGATFGDQKYLDSLMDKYKNKIIMECDDPGVGIAPWNIQDYSLIGDNLFYKKDKCYPVFYHFQGIEFEEGFVKTNINKINNKVDTMIISKFYKPYISLIIEKRKKLHNIYNIDFSTNYSIRFVEYGIKAKIRELFLKNSLFRMKYYSRHQYIFKT